MKKTLTYTAAAFVALMVLQSSSARAQRYGIPNHTIHDTRAAWHASLTPWHSPYYHKMYGRPVPLVVPPNAGMQTNFGWGVTGSEMTPINHQYGRAYPGDAMGLGATQLSPTPYWPSNTRQLGTYYIRAPW